MAEKGNGSRSLNREARRRAVCPEWYGSRRHHRKNPPESLEGLYFLSASEHPQRWNLSAVQVCGHSPGARLRSHRDPSAQRGASALRHVQPTRAYDRTLARYTREKEVASVLAIHRQLYRERIEELRRTEPMGHPLPGDILEPDGPSGRSGNEV